MPVDPAVLRRARRGNITAAIDVLAACYPQVHRIAYALSGRDDVGRGVVRFVMRRGLRRMPTWKHAADPDRWCQHHTLLTTRRAARHQPDLATDTLLRHVKTDAGNDAGSDAANVAASDPANGAENVAAPDHAYAAFVRAVRALPPQQREAFLLHHGEQLDVRSLGIAMDCSQDAAAQHLNQATRSLAALEGEQFALFTQQLARSYRELTPSEELILDSISRDAKRYLWPRRVLRWIRLLVTLAILAAAAWFAWRIYPNLIY